MTNTIQKRAASSLLGLALGDAIGTTLEFRSRDTYEHLTTMAGGGPFDLPPGYWTDDTSMAIALGESLVRRNGFDATDLMNRFVNWWRHGMYSSTGECFDIGTTVRTALETYERTGDPFAGSASPDAAGNGSLMRLAPVAIWGTTVDQATMRKVARDQSATTHGAAQCLDACEGYAIILRSAIEGSGKKASMMAAEDLFTGVIGEILDGGWKGKERHEIRSSGYVAHSLEAALWCVDRTDSLMDAVLLAANLGDDADTTAAITGQLAGALYGMDDLPAGIMDRLYDAAAIRNLATRLLG